MDGSWAACWLKLEVPASQLQQRERREKKNRELTEPLVAELKLILERQDITLVSEQAFRVVEEDDCEPFLEANFEVSSSRFAETLLPAMQQFLNTIKREPCELPNLVLHSQEFWKTELLIEKCAIRMKALFFGNLQEGVFLKHWEVSFLNSRPYSRNASSSLFENISVDFKFDHPEIITAQFQVDEIERGKMERVTYCVGVRRDSIRRIIVDPIVNDRGVSGLVRIHFELNCPVNIKRGKQGREQMMKNPDAKPFYHRRKRFDFEWVEDGTRHGTPQDAAISDSPFFTIQFDSSVEESIIYQILCRLRDRTGVSIEFARIPFKSLPMGRKDLYNRWTIQPGGMVLRPTDRNAPIFKDFITFDCFGYKDELVDGRWVDVNEERRFAITYLIECLLSRGAVVKDQLLVQEDSWVKFLEIVLFYYQKDDKLCEAALEDLVHLIDGRRRIGDLIKCFDKLCRKRQRLALVNGLTENEQREGYVRVRKVVFTPTRTIYVTPETIMGNRVLRKHDKDGTRVLRIVFRDDNNRKMRKSVTEDLLDMIAHKRLKDGIVVANRDYGFLGCSNSQMRDNGAYFMLKYTDEQLEKHKQKHSGEINLINFIPLIKSVRKDLGRFETVENVPKMMARLGQCFTQSRMSGVELKRSTFTTTYDLAGGKNSAGKHYEFSDGVGMISRQFAEQISRAMQLGNATPSCFQIRFRGIKGVIAIEPLLDKIRQFSMIHDVEDPSGGTSFDLNCVFRPSQIKFIAKKMPGEQIEIVKFSAPVPVALNKPFINILDQVSEMQSLECHRRITNRIEELMDSQIQRFARQLTDETMCRNQLKEFPFRVDVDFLRNVWGFNLAAEPFFRSLIKAAIKFSITKQIRKEQIPIPHQLGRSMLGVVDETGRLQYGQIFVQYTKNLALKLPHERAHREILTGTVLLTKNPCIVAGDVRIFEAVDIPELHHMCDVVVFPQHGPRPHPDEMAGSDLDGDEYSVIWDPQLLLDKNEEPFDFTAEKNPQTFNMEEIDDLTRQFYVDYMKQDSVGQISNSHLHCSDQYGINAPVCMDLARKNSQAVDFTKSGRAPEPLLTKWRVDPKTGEEIPPEIPERIPDYHIGNDNLPMYVSPRICGKLYREFKAIDEVIKISEERDEQIDVTIDENVKYEGYEEEMESARKMLANYNGQLRAIMENYGIKTEGEIMSGAIIDMRNRISDKDQDDMSFYNTNQMIETKVSSLTCAFREKFFAEFGGYKVVCELKRNFSEDSNILHWQCFSPSKRIMRKAVAWYRACYEEARRTKENKKLSFAWIAYDVIAKVKEYNILNREEIETVEANPLFTMLDKHRSQYLHDNIRAFGAFRSLESFGEGASVERAVEILKMYMTANPGLDEVLFMLTEWVRAGELLKRTSMQMHHFCLLFLLFTTRQIGSPDGDAVVLVKKLSKDETDVQKGKFEPDEMVWEKKKSEMVVKFFEFLASRKFRKLPNLSFRSLGFSSVFMRGEWQIFHVAALKTYYNILFNLRFEELPVSTDPTITVRSIIRENEPFVIEVPSSCKTDELREVLIEKSGVAELAIRRMKRNKEEKDNSDKRVPSATDRLQIMCRGSVEAIQRVRHLCAVTIPLKSHVGGKGIANQMARLCHARITGEFV